MWVIVVYHFGYGVDGDGGNLPELTVILVQYKHNGIEQDNALTLLGWASLLGLVHALGFTLCNKGALGPLKIYAAVATPDDGGFELLDGVEGDLPPRFDVDLLEELFYLFLCLEE